MTNGSTDGVDPRAMALARAAESAQNAGRAVNDEDDAAARAALAELERRLEAAADALAVGDAPPPPPSALAVRMLARRAAAALDDGDYMLAAGCAQAAGIADLARADGLSAASPAYGVILLAELLAPLADEVIHDKTDEEEGYAAAAVLIEVMIERLMMASHVFTADAIRP